MQEASQKYELFLMQDMRIKSCSLFQMFLVNKYHQFIARMASYKKEIKMIKNLHLFYKTYILFKFI